MRDSSKAAASLDYVASQQSIDAHWALCVDAAMDALYSPFSHLERARRLLAGEAKWFEENGATERADQARRLLARLA